MISAFGVMHEISKAQKRDAQGRFARTSSLDKLPKGEGQMSDEEYELHQQSYLQDLKHLFKAEGNDKRWQEHKKRLESYGDYLDRRDEGHFADDVFIALQRSEHRHKVITSKRTKS